MTKNDMRVDKLRAEIDQNFIEFTKNIDTFMTRHQNKYALMRDGRVESFFLTWQDAFNTGNLLFDDKIFSIQRVTKTPVDLGFFSRV